jgi:hypothetical protein
MSMLRSIPFPLPVLAGVLAVMCCVASDRVHAEPPFSGEDAAMIDWAWKNCKFKHTGRVREFVAKAMSGREAAYTQAYNKYYQSIVAKARGSAAVRRMCDSIAEEYGPLGTKFSGLLLTPGAQASGGHIDSFAIPEKKDPNSGRPPSSPGSRKGGGF